MEKEIWKDIDGYNGLYQVSNLGNVKSLNYHRENREKQLSLTKDSGGYLFVGLCKNGERKQFLIHRLVAKAFIENPKNLPEVNHINEDKTDNCVENLEWCTAKYNTNYGTRTDKTKKPILQFDKNMNFIRRWNSITDVKRELGFGKGNISKCCRGEIKSIYGYVWKFAELKDKKVA